MYVLQSIPGTGASLAPVGQFTMGQVDAITQADVIREFSNRGYLVERAAIAPPITAVGVTKERAIAAAVDESIYAYGLSRTASRPFYCPAGDAGCPVSAAVWQSMIPYTVMIANGFLTGKYSIGQQFAGLSGGLSGWVITDWLADHPLVVTIAGSTITAIGAHLTAQQVKDELKKAIPAEYLTKENLPEIIAALRQAGVVDPLQQDALNKGAMAATTPSWLMPALIAGGALLVVMLMKR